MSSPPLSVRRTLRGEVGFGCPVEGCGDPYLSYHHFDPPLRIKKHDNPEGMVALCLQHHKAADQGAFSDGELRELKKNPYLRRTGDTPRGRFLWKRQQLVLLGGGNFLLGSDTLLTHGGIRVAWLSTDSEHNELLNLDLYGSTGNMILYMRDNDWLVDVPLDDLECSTSGHYMKIVAARWNIWLSIRFDALNTDELLAKVRKISDKVHSYAMKKMPEVTTGPGGSLLSQEAMCEREANMMFRGLTQFIGSEEIVLCTIEGDLAWPNTVTLREDHLQNARGSIWAGCISAGNTGASIAI